MADEIYPVNNLLATAKSGIGVVSAVANVSVPSQAQQYHGMD